MLKRNLFVLASFAVLLLASAACGGGDGGNEGHDSTTTPADTATPPDTAAPDTAAPSDTAVPDTATPDVAPADTAVEAETGATPTPPQLTSAHTGWRNPGCLSCHSYDAHNDGQDPYLCAGCHGTNGAPTPPHENRAGCNCHGDPHGADGFPQPVSCKACHFPQ